MRAEAPRMAEARNAGATGHDRRLPGSCLRHLAGRRGERAGRRAQRDREKTVFPSSPEP